MATPATPRLTRCKHKSVSLATLVDEMHWFSRRLSSGSMLRDLLRMLTLIQTWQLKD